MTHAPTDDPIARIHDYTANTTLLDVDAIVRSGRRRRRSRQASAAGGIAVVAAAVVGVAVIAGTSGHNATRSVVNPASAPDPARGLVGHYAVAGQVETLATTSSGWQADAYVDTAGDMCEGWVDPATSVMQGACGQALATSGPTNETTLISPLLIEPEAAVARRTVYAFGLAGPTTATVGVTNKGKPLKVALASVRSADGQRAFLVQYRIPRIADWVDYATATDTNGAVVGSAEFVAPDTGTPAHPGPAPTP